MVVGLHNKMTDFNVLKPQLIWVNERCYRKLPIRKAAVNPEEVEYDMYTSQQFTRNEEDYDLKDIDIKHLTNTFWTTISVPSALYGVIIGKKYANLRRIENETRTKITVPRESNNESGEISITGDDRWGVGTAYRQIETIATNARWRQEFTHFVSLPMNFDNLKTSFLEFKQEVLSKSSRIRGIDDRIFQNPEKLHLTIVTLTLLDKREREKAAAVLQKFKEDVRVHLESKPLIVSVKGIEYMNDDPSEVDVLYAKVRDHDGEAKLQILADSLLAKFEATGLVKKQNERVKLHITLMNTIFRSGEDSEKRGRFNSRNRETFDSRSLLENYGDYDFGIVTLSEIHISVRYSSGRDGYYSSTSILKLPTI